MPKVPTYDEPQVNPQINSTQKFDAALSTEMASVPFRQIQQVGQSVTNFGESIGKVAKSYLDDVNEAEVRKADSAAMEYINDLMNNPEKGFMMRNGEDAIKSQEDVKEALHTGIQMLGEKLTNDDQRKMWERVAKQRIDSATSQMNAHTIQQARVYNDTQIVARVKASTQDAVSKSGYWGQSGKSPAVEAIEANLTPQEMNIVNYHRNTILEGKAGKDDNGNPVTVYSVSIEIPDGPMKGKFVTVPGYWDGEKHDDEHQVWEKWKDDINASAWPVYDSANEADSRAKMLHGIMDVEGDKPLPANQFKIAKDTVLSDVDALAKNRGYDPASPQGQQMRLEALTSLHQNVIQNMIATGNTQRARLYFEANAGEIDPTKLDNIKNLLKTAAVKDESLRLTFELKGDLNTQIKSVETMFKDGKIDADVYDATRTRLEHNWQVNKAQQAEAEKSLIGNAQDWLMKNPDKTVSDLPPAMYNSLKNTGHLGTLVAFAKNGRYENNAQTWAEIMSNPQDLKSMSPNEIFLKYRGKLDDSHLEKAYAMNAALNGSKDEQHLSIMSTAEMVKDSAVKMGIIKATGKPSENEAKSFNEFQSKIDARVAAYETTELQGKRKASQEELKKILQQVEIDQVYRHRSVMPDDKKPVMSLTEGELKDAYVKVGEEEIKLSSIPASQRALIIPALRAAGRPVTEQNIADYWVRGGKKK